MEKIPFKDLPDTSIPYNAETFNLLQDNVENAINTIETTLENSVYYKSGDTYSINGQYYCGGNLTGSTKAIVFSIILPKLVTNITSVTINSINLTARGINGYLLNSADLTTLNSSGQLSVVSLENNCVSFQFTANEAFSSTNNTPVSIYLKNTSITFN